MQQLKSPKRGFKIILSGCDDELVAMRYNILTEISQYPFTSIQEDDDTNHLFLIAIENNNCRSV